MAYVVDDNYQSKARKPDDFDAFWDDVKAQVARVDLNPEVAPEPLRSDDEVEVFQSFYDSIDNVRIAAWYCLPRGAQGPLPAIMVVPGYQSDPGIPKEWARRGYAALGVAPRGKLRSNTQFNPGYPGLLTYGMVDRNVYSYRGFYVDAWRGVDFLLSRSEVDPRQDRRSPAVARAVDLPSAQLPCETRSRPPPRARRTSPGSWTQSS